MVKNKAVVRYAVFCHDLCSVKIISTQMFCAVLVFFFPLSYSWFIYRSAKNHAQTHLLSLPRKIPHLPVVTALTFWEAPTPLWRHLVGMSWVLPPPTRLRLWHQRQMQPPPGARQVSATSAVMGINLGMGSANESRRYYVIMPSLIRQTHNKDDPLLYTWEGWKDLVAIYALVITIQFPLKFLRKDPYDNKTALV